MINSGSFCRIGLALLMAAMLSAATDDDAEPIKPSIAGDPSCAMSPIPLATGADGKQTATGHLENRPGTLVRDGVAALPLSGQPGLVVIDAQWTDPSRGPGPDIEIVQCEAVNAAALLLGGTTGKSTSDDAATVTMRPRRLDRSYDRNIAAKGEPGRSRAALMLTYVSKYVILIGGAPPGTDFTMTILRSVDNRPTPSQLQLPLTRGTINSDSVRQNASLRPYALYSLKIETEGPVLFTGTASGPVFLEVGDVSDDAAFDWFGLRRAGTPGNVDGEVERLMLWRTLMAPGKISAFGLNLKPGSYLVRLRGEKRDSFGDYSVTMAIPKPADLLLIPEPQRIKPGVTRGTLVIGENFGQDADGAPQVRPAKLYQFAGRAGSGYEVRLESDGPELDPFLSAGGMLPVLETPSRNSQSTASGERYLSLLVNNDHLSVAGMKDAKSSCLFFTARKNGPIVLKVIGARVNQAGEYTLTLTESSNGCRPAPKE